MARKVLLLSVDFEDWHQLARRRLGIADWARIEPALARQTQAALALLDARGLRATFFVLGMVARERPELIAEIARRGHEIACHGDLHMPVHSLTPAQFAADLRSAREAIEQASGQRPLGYRAPAFSITGPAASWAYGVLAREGFLYDASQHDSPRIRARAVDGARGAHRMKEGLWELPVAVWRTRALPVPVGGASYWSLMPRALLLRGLDAAEEHAGLYLHPYELGPDPLDLSLPRRTPLGTRMRAGILTRRREAARRRAPLILQAISERFDLIPYGDAILDERPRAGAPPLPR